MERQGGVYLGLDVGGTSITAAVVGGGRFFLPARRYPAHSGDSAGAALDHLTDILREALGSARGEGLGIRGIGIGFPGPFDYERGLYQMRGLGKFESVYGVSLKEELKWRVGGNPDIRFANSADLYCLGECVYGQGRGFDRVICLCIGSGIGSGFYADGKLVKSGRAVPKNGWIYREPLRSGIAEQYISASGLRSRMQKLPSLKGLPDVKELAEKAKMGNEHARRQFQEFGELLAELVLPWCVRFDARCLVIGGDAAHSFDLFSAPVVKALNARGIQARPSQAFLNNTLLAASLLFEHTEGKAGMAAL